MVAVLVHVAERHGVGAVRLPWKAPMISMSSKESVMWRKRGTPSSSMVPAS